MIRPIHMQMTLPQSETAGNIRQFENQRIANDSNFAANQLAKTVKQNHETVIAKDPNAFADYRYDAKEEGNGTYQNPRKRKNKKEHNQEENTEVILSDSYNAETQPRVNIQI